MKQKRGRKTSAPMKILDAGIQKRPEPPGHLTSEAQKIWATVIKLHPANWLKEDLFQELEHLCDHIVLARFLKLRITGLIADPPDDFEVRLRPLLAMHEVQTRACTAKARTLRITNQSRYVPDSTSARSGSGGKKLWEM